MSVDDDDLSDERKKQRERFEAMAARARHLRATRPSHPDHPETAAEQAAFTDAARDRQNAAIFANEMARREESSTGHA